MNYLYQSASFAFQKEMFFTEYLKYVIKRIILIFLHVKKNHILHNKMLEDVRIYICLGKMQKKEVPY